MTSFKDLQRNFVENQLADHFQLTGSSGVLTVGHSHSAATVIASNDTVFQPVKSGGCELRDNNWVASGTTPKAPASLKQDYSEADGDGDPEAMFPELYKTFNAKIDELSKYVGLVESPFDFIDEIHRFKLFGNLSYAMRKASEGLAWAFVQQKMAYARRKESEAVARLDDFPEYIQSEAEAGRTVKPTDATAEAFVKKSPRVIRASMREATVDAMVEQLAVLKMEFAEATRTLRSMVYGQKDSNNLSTSSGG